MDAEPPDLTSKLADLLKHPDDLTKLPALKSEFLRKKLATDTSLRQGLTQQLETTSSGMSNLSSAQKTVAAIKEEMMRIDRLCGEAQGMIRDFPEINRMSVVQRNFAAVEGMMSSLEGLGGRLAELEELLREDDAEPEVLGNLLTVHEGLSALRGFRDEAVEQVRGAGGVGEGESGVELIENLPLEGGGTLRDMFNRLDGVVEWFDEHVGQACINLIPLVQAGNNSLVVRLALVIEEEERKDRQVKALQDARAEFKDVASRFKSINVSQRELRGYKAKFLQAVEASAAAQFQPVEAAFADDPERLEKSLRWFFNDLNTVKLGLQDLVPKRWKIFRTYANIYHKLMHDFLVSRLDDTSISPVHMLAILNWSPKYYAKMAKLGLAASSLTPHVIDDREPELVREYRNLITTAVEQWMDRIAVTDQSQFSSRTEGALDQDGEGRLHTKALGDVWTMLREQLAVAESSGRPDVVEGVVESMYRALRLRQGMWERTVDAEAAGFESGALGQEAVGGFHDWLVAIANDQIAIIDDNTTSGHGSSFLTRFRSDYEPIVTPTFFASSLTTHEQLSNAYVDLSTHCTALFARAIFAVDFRSLLPEFFTSAWYSRNLMGQVISTFEDYLNDYTGVLHPSLREILVEELAEELLVRYLGCVRNKGVKFRRQDPFTDKMKEDILAVFEFFGTNYPEAFDGIKQKYRVISSLGDLLSADKGQGVVEAYTALKAKYWDVQIGWVEAVLRSRDDSDRGMLAAVRKRAAEVSGERGVEGVLSKVR